MNLQSPSKASRSTANTATSNSTQLFDLEYYRSRLAGLVSDTEEKNRILFEALDFSYNLHAGQRRKSGAPYISHPCAVAEILARELKLQDPVLLSAALLHDVVEDVPSIDTEDIARRFGEMVAELVDGCTKLTRYHLDRSTLKDLTHSKIFLSASRRLGVLIIKLGDRLHNLRTLHFLPIAKRQRIAQETVEVYAPIAAKLNIFPLKRELYHLALSYLYPRKSKKILHLTQGLLNSPPVQQLENALQEAFSGTSLTASIRPRLKGLGSYYNPLKRTLDLANAENQVDFTIVLENEDALSCYCALGIVNSVFPPIPRTLRDFIANPKNNGYRSIHVRINVGGQSYLVKIRTPEMDLTAMYGILSHWDSQKPMSDEHWLEVSELLRNIGEYGGAGSQRKALIRLAETEEIFVLTPRGDIYYFPQGSIVLDFAYKIHSDLGDHCTGALVNGILVAPTHRLSDGDTVDVLTSEEFLDVDPDIEQLCRTPKARTAINKHLQQKRLNYAEKIGREILLQEFEKHGLSKDLLTGENTRLILEVINVESLPELFIRIGQDLLSPHLVLYYFAAQPDHKQDTAQPAASPPATFHSRNVVRISELDKALHKFARCCNPFPGQDHVVATLSERGITFHYVDCTDLLQRHDLPPQRLVGVQWDMESAWRHPLEFHLQALQTTPVSLFPSLVHMLPAIQVRSMECGFDRNDQPVTHLRVFIRSFQEARSLYASLPPGQVTIENFGRA